MQTTIYIESLHSGGKLSCGGPGICGVLWIARLTVEAGRGTITPDSFRPR